MTEELKKSLIEDFHKEMEDYEPNWEKIINTNPDPSKLDKEAKGYKINSFCERIKIIRKKRGITQKELGSRLSVTKQTISKIENKKIKSIPPKYFDKIFDQFEVSGAYLLGLVDDEAEHPSKSFYYFHEDPEEKYNDIKEYVIEPSLYSLMVWDGYPKKRLVDNITMNLENNYDLALALFRIFESNRTKRDLAIKTIMNVADIIAYDNYH